MRVAIVVPALNEEPTIAAVVGGACRFGDLVVVDDGSSDRTAQAAEAAGAHVLRHARTMGYDASLQTGFSYAADAKYDIVATIDADGQHDPELLAALLKPIRDSGAEVVIGIRPKQARMAEWAFRTYGRQRFGVPDLLCGMKAFTIGAYRRHATAMDGRSIGTGLAVAALRAGEPHATVAVPIRPRSGRPRFGGRLSANLRIVVAMIRTTGGGRRR